MRNILKRPRQSTADRPRLARELRVTLSRRMALAAALITLLASGLHLGWSLYQRNVLEDRLRDALAQSLQEPLRAHQLPAVHAILRAFSAATPGAEICVHLPGGDWLKVPRCGTALFETYTLNLSGDQFSVSVTLPLLDRMVLFGVPFALAIFATLLLASQYLKAVTNRVLGDLERLASSPAGGSAVHYYELAQAADKIAKGLQLQEENFKLAAEARIGAIAEIAGHDVRAPLATLQVLSSEVARNLSERKQRVLQGVMFRIEEVAADLLEVGRLAGNEGTGGSVQWPPSSRRGHRIQEVALAAIIEAMVEEKSVQYQDRQGLEILSKIDPKAAWLVVWLVPRDLERVLSNLIGNAVEAISGPGAVEVTLRRQGASVEIGVRDNGRGISAEAQGRLMKKRETFGKENGSGLGLFDAKEKIESWGGTVEIESAPGVGTQVRLRLPLAGDPAEIPEKPDLVLIDDNPTVHDGWSLDAEEIGLRLATFPAAEPFLARLPSLDRDTPIYVDKNGHEDGLKLGARLAALGFRNLHLTTGERAPAAGPPPGFRSVVGKDFPRQAVEMTT